MSLYGVTKPQWFKYTQVSNKTKPQLVKYTQVLNNTKP